MKLHIEKIDPVVKGLIAYSVTGSSDLFQFSDMLVYASRTATPLLQFKVHGQLPLRGMIVSISVSVLTDLKIE